MPPRSPTTRSGWPTGSVPSSMPASFRSSSAATARSWSDRLSPSAVGRSPRSCRSGSCTSTATPTSVIRVTRPTSVRPPARISRSPPAVANPTSPTSTACGRTCGTPTSCCSAYARRTTTGSTSRRPGSRCEPSRSCGPKAPVVRRPGRAISLPTASGSGCMWTWTCSTRPSCRRSTRRARVASRTRNSSCSSPAWSRRRRVSGSRSPSSIRITTRTVCMRVMSRTRSSPGSPRSYTTTRPSRRRPLSCRRSAAPTDAEIGALGDV